MGQHVPAVRSSTGECECTLDVMKMKHIGIVACSAEGAALCYQTICREALTLVGKNDHPRITLDSIAMARWLDRKSTRLNSSHGYISYAVFCLKKKKKTITRAAS